MILFLVGTSVVSCGGGGNNSGNSTQPPATNRSPVYSGSADVTVEENMTFSFVVSASDPEGSALTITLLSQADGSFFQLDQTTNTISAISEFDFELPLDEDNDNSYSIVVSASDGQTSTNRTYTISVTNSTSEPFFEERGAVAIIPDGGVASRVRLGTSIAAAGDLNSDGKGDLLIGAPEFSPTIFNPGVGSLFMLSGDYVSQTAEGIIEVGALPSGVSVRIDGEESRDRIGSFATAVADLDGDNAPEILTSSPSVSRVASNASGESYVIFSATVLDALSGGGVIDLGIEPRGDNIVQFSYDGGNTNAGSAARNTLSDLDGDDLDEILVCVPQSNSPEGAAYIVFGDAVLDASTGTGIIELTSVEASGQGVRIQAETTLPGRPSGICGTILDAGDINNDGFHDVLLTTPSQEGGVYLVSGEEIAAQRTGLGIVDLLTAVPNGNAVKFSSELTSGFIGNPIFLGDINSDGFDDFSISNISADGAGLERSGQVYFIFGTASFFGAPPMEQIREDFGENGLNARIDGAQAQLLFGTGTAALIDPQGTGESLFFARAQGSSDPGTTIFAFRLSDIVAGSIQNTGSALFRLTGIDDMDSFGGRMVSAGDMDGDGYEDLFIGADRARLFTATGGTNGEAYIVSGAKLFTSAQTGETINLASLFPSLDD